MSYYYSYYLGYKTKENKIYPLGPYDHDGKLHPVVCRSRSFASDLHERFYRIHDEEIAEELLAEFEYDTWDGDKLFSVKQLPLSELPCGGRIRRGYFLISDVKGYESDPYKDCSDWFFDRISPEIYAAMMQNELAFGLPTEKQVDIERNEFETHSCRDYMYYAYEDTTSEEYEADEIRRVASIFEFAIPDGAQIVVLETEG